jgi:hypothetical protein
VEALPEELDGLVEPPLLLRFQSRGALFLYLAAGVGRRLIPGESQERAEKSNCFETGFPFFRRMIAHVLTCDFILR